MRISVLITSYNQRDYLEEAIESVLAQSLKPSEILIADDHSTDASPELIRTYATRYPGWIRPFFQEQNLGIPRNRNFALEQVRGELVTSLDGDDRFHPRKLELELETLRHDPRARVCFSNYRYIDAAGEDRGQWADPQEEPPTGWVLPQVFARSFPKHSLYRSELVYHDVLREAGFHDPSFPIYEDWELRIRVASLVPVVYCPEVLLDYRRHEGGISNGDLGYHLKIMQQVYRKNCGLLDGLPPEERRTAKRTLLRYFAGLAGRVARVRLREGRRKRAFRYWLRSFRLAPRSANGRLLRKILLARGTPRKKDPCPEPPSSPA